MNLPQDFPFTLALSRPIIGIREISEAVLTWVPAGSGATSGAKREEKEMIHPMGVLII